MARSESPTSVVAPFEVHAKQVMLQLRSALGAIVEALPESVRRASELERALGIDKTLAWKVMRLVQAKDAFRAGQHMPGLAGMRIFLNAAARTVPDDLIVAGRAAEAEFEKLTKLHAGDRKSLLMMLRACVTGRREEADVTQRRAAFLANGYILGVQAKAQVKADFLHPSVGRQGILDIASVRGFIDLRRLRSNVPWVIGRGRTSDDDGQVRSATMREPLEPGSQSGVALLRSFCTVPPPQLRRVPGEHGFVEDELVEGPVGNIGAITCITGDVTREVGSYYRDEHNRWGTVNARLYTPCEVLVFDQFIHEGMFGPITPELGVYSDLSGRMWTPVVLRPRDRLPSDAVVMYLGKGPSVIYTPHIPRYAEMVRYVFEKLGWSAERFDVYRVVIEYPVIPSTVAMTHKLPEAPG